MLLSIVVCTYNRAAMLEQLLNSLCVQTLPVVEFEVIVVDNASSGATQEVIKRYLSRLPNLRGVVELQTGLSHARNRGWREALGEYVGYIDDDAKAPANWLKTAEEVILRFTPDILGGPYDAYYDQPKPIWFKDEYSSFHPSERAFQLERRKQFLSGGNLFIKRNLLEVMGGFRSELGMRGETLGYGEETDFMLRVWEKHPDALVLYEPDLVVSHLVRASKWSLRKQCKTHFEKGRFQYLTFSVENEPLKSRHVLGFIGLPILIIFKATFGTVFRDRKRYRFPENYLFERVFRDIQIWGKLFERLRQSISRIMKLGISQTEQDATEGDSSNG